MRTIAGDILLPANCPSIKDASVLIEVREVSRVDAPSTVVAHTRLTDVDIRPGTRVAFSLPLPEVPDAGSLEFRIHVSIDKSERVRSGDLLTTASYRVPMRETPGPLTVPVTLI